MRPAPRDPSERFSPASSLTFCRCRLCSRAFVSASIVPALAIESVRVPLDVPAIDLTKAIESYSSQGDRLLVSTAPGADGIVRRIEVRAKDVGTRPSWIVFALTNDTDEQIERLIVAPALPPRRVGRYLARPRRHPHLGDHGQPGHLARARGCRPTPMSSA